MYNFAICSQTLESNLHQHIEEEMANPNVDKPANNVQFLCMTSNCKFYILLSYKICTMFQPVCLVQC